MLGRFLLMAVTLAFVLVTGCNKDSYSDYKKVIKSDLLTKAQKESYVFGSDLSKKLEQSKEAFDFDCFMQGFTDQVKKRPMLLDDAEMNLVRVQGRKAIEEAEKLKQSESPEKWGEDNDVFFNENKNKENVKLSPGGIQYIIFKEGNGTRPTENDKVKVRYIGSLINGTEFENTYKSEEPVEFPLKNVVPGLKEGLMMMSVGSKYKLFVPPGLAYGTSTRGVIQPYSVLIYEVELLEIVK